MCGIRLLAALPNSTKAKIAEDRVLRSGTSAREPLRESQNAKPDADQLSRIDGSHQLLEENEYSIGIIEEIKLFKPGQIVPINAETRNQKANFITAIYKIKAPKP